MLAKRFDPVVQGTIRSEFRMLLAAFSLMCAALFTASVRADSIDPAGYGALGDSFADEYQFYPPDRSTARNFVELLASDRNLNFGSFSTVSRGDPRNQGYAYDWALSGAESGDLPAQTAGLAQQVAAGQVKTTFMFVGGNDFLDALETSSNPRTFFSIPETLLTNVMTAAGTILGASPGADLVIANVFDVTQLPVAQEALSLGLVNQSELQTVSQIIAGYNQALASAVAGNKRIALVDLNSLSKQIFSGSGLTVDGIPINVTTPGDQYNDLFLADGLHLGTVGQGLLANAFVAAADTHFNAGIAPLTEAEIIQSAKSVPAAVPLPRTWEMGVVGLLAAAAASTKISRRVLR
jgi:hypothetical protein